MTFFYFILIAALSLQESNALKSYQAYMSTCNQSSCLQNNFSHLNILLFCYYIVHYVNTHIMQVLRMNSSFFPSRQKWWKVHRRYFFLSTNYWKYEAEESGFEKTALLIEFIYQKYQKLSKKTIHHIVFLDVFVGM